MSNALLVPGHRVCEYRLMIPLPEVLGETIWKIQVGFYERYKITLLTTPNPSLTLLNCHAYEGTQDKLVERIQQVATRIAAFPIELQNFNTCAGNSIGINVANQNAIYELTKELKVIKSLINLPEHEPAFVAEPCIVIAKNLKPFQFIRMWMDCERQQFTGKFIAKEMTLLKRSIHNDNFEPLRRFEFTSVVSGIKQGVLFG